MKSKFKRKILRLFIISSILFIFLTAVGFNIALNLIDYKMPEIVNIELYDNNEKLYLSYTNDKKQTFVKLENISLNIINAFVCIEDKRFYDHHGVDTVRVGGALLKNIKTKKIKEGASTITQQYVRNTYLTNEKTWQRKIKEMMISINIERHYNKDQILEGYLNSIYFDHGVYGVEDACLYYFGKHSNEVDLAEACSIASIPKGPTIYSPIKNPENNNERKLLILNELKNDGIISNETYKKEASKQLNFKGIDIYKQSDNAPYFQDAVINELKNIPQVEIHKHKGLKVYTTLDEKLYNKITESINNRMPNSDVETAICAMNPKTGEVLAIIGGKDYNKSTFNRAINSYRQPGSAIKPLLYLTALENGFNPSTTFKSEPTTFYLNNTAYSPTNYKSIYANQEISMVYALATSDNMYAMKTHLFLGVDKFRESLNRFNFEKPIPNVLSLALGTLEVSPFELTKAYAIIANEGIKVKPTFIRKITTFDGELIYENEYNKKRVAEESDCYILNEAMTSIFDDNLTINIRPTGVSIKSMLNGKFSAKSGSTDTDNWMIGYNPEIVVCVWSGYDDSREVVSLEDSKFAKYIWADSVSLAKNAWYETPIDVVGYNLSPISGFIPSMTEYTKIIYFRKKNLPWFVDMLKEK